MTQKMYGRFSIIPTRKKHHYHKNQMVVVRKDTLVKETPLMAKDVKMYFKSIIQGRRIGEYCQRCGAGIGEDKVNNISIKWKGFIICEPCFKDKISGLPENTPDLEDIKRFNIQLC